MKDTLKSKFNISYSKIIESYLGKRRKTKSLFECNFPLFKSNYYFSQYVANIISEDYHIFPVPKKLLDSIENFILNNNTNIQFFNEKIYNFQDILKYSEDWDYYNEFKTNIELLLKEKHKCSIICCVFNSKEGAENILEKYKSDEITTNEICNSFASIYTYKDDGFNACITVNANGNVHKIRKIIQHELIHWMQVSLNSHIDKTYGIFNDVKFNLTDDQIGSIINLLGISKIDFKNTFEYLLNGCEFEAWVANTCEEFSDSNFSIDNFKNIIENEDIFKQTFIESDYDKREMLLFAKICYLTSMNDKSDDRWWYLLEALKEN